MNVSALFKTKSSAELAKAVVSLLVLSGLALSGNAAQAETIKTTHKTAGRVTGSVYCVNGTVTVKGWEKDLVRRNPGLRRFNWTPITAAKPGILVFRQPGQESSTKQYHYAKPKVLSYAEMRAAQRMQEQRAAQVTAARMSNADVSARLSSKNTGLEYNLGNSRRLENTQNVQGQMVSTYGSATLSQPATYSSSYVSTGQKKVNGRLISSHL
ncbi:hypothetical protein BH11CYA1_BH11CYA1_07440 [soil metagenome]